jgi:hypothetical protein
LRDRGYEVTDPDAADAIAGWEYACSIIAPGVKPYSAVPFSAGGLF